MSELTVSVVLSSVEALKELSNKDLSINISVKLVKIIKELNEVLEVYDTKRNELYIKYGEEIENGSMKILDENLETFNKEFDVLKEEEIDIEFEQINVSNLSDINMKTSTLMSLDWLIEF